MKIIRIKNEWIELLFDVDSEVLFNKNEQRPYLYIPIVVNNIDYAIPLSSVNVENENDGQLPIEDDVDHLGTLMINKMIPVPEKYIIHFNYKNEEKKYKNLLRKQIKLLNENKEKIEAMTKRIHKNKISSNKNRNLRKQSAIKYSVNFLLLEELYLKEIECSCISL